MFNKNVFVLALIITLIGINSASAEEGNITLTNRTDPTYFAAGTVASAPAPDWTSFLVSSSNYNQIEQIFINTTGTNVAYATNGRSTTFTITSGGSGGGFVSYSKASNAIGWYFTNPSTITGSPLVLSYTDNIFADVSAPTWATDGSGATTAALPLFVKMSGFNQRITGTCNLPCGGGMFQDMSYSVVIASNVVNHYNISYITGGVQLFNTTITKTGYSTTNTKVTIENATGTPVNYTFQGDNTFNTNDWSVINTYGQGIALNMTTAIGDFERVIVNTTGSAIPTPAPTPQNAPYTSGNSINTTKTTYYNNESVNIFGSYYPATTTTTSCLFFSYICTDTTINTEDNAGYVFIWTPGSSSPVKFIKFTPDTFHNYNLLTNLDVGTYTAQLYGFAAPGVACQGGIVYDFGAQGVELGCYYPHNTTSFQVLNATPGLYIHWNTKLANQTTLYGETVSVAWTNVTANDTVSIFDANNTLDQSYNINSSSVNFLNVYIPLYTTGTWRATIFNGSNQSDNTSSYLNVVPQGAVNLPNDFGITMYWQQGASTINTPVTLNWNAGDYVGFYNITVLKDGVEVRRTGYYAPHAGLSYQASYTFGSTGTYVAQFVDSPNETVQAQADIFISTSIVSSPGTGNITPATGQQIQDTGTNLLNLFAVTAFYGLIIWLGIVGTIAGIMFKASGSINTGALVFIAVLAATFVALVGLFDPYKWYVLVLTWIFAGIYWRMNRDMVTEG